MVRQHVMRHRLLLGAALAMLLMSPSGQAAPPPQALAVLLVKEDLGTLPGDTGGSARGINSSRQIVGESTGPDSRTVFLWTPPGPMVALSAPEGVTLDRAGDINDGGQVVGTGGGLENFFDAFVWTPPGDVVGLGNVGLFDEEGAGINNLGWAVGCGEVPPYAPTIWVPPGPNLVIPGTAGAVGCASDVNDSGEVVGNTQIWSAGASRPFYWSQADGLIQLAGLDADSSGLAHAINLGGAIVGQSTSGGIPRAVMWPSFDVNPVDLGTLGGASAIARGISNNGVVVGRSELADPDVTHAFRRSPGGPMQDLGTLGGLNSEAFDVNSAGHAVGTADNANGQPRAVAWWRYNAASAFTCACQEWDPAPSWPRTILIAVLIPGSPTLHVGNVDASTLTLGDGDGDDAPVAVANGRRLALRGDFDGDGERDLLVAFSRKQVSALTARGHAAWLVGALRDRSNGVFGRVARPQ